MAKINQFKLAFLYHPPSFSPPSPYSLLSASSRYLISLDVETMDILKPDAPAAAAQPLYANWKEVSGVGKLRGVRVYLYKGEK